MFTACACDSDNRRCDSASQMYRSSLWKRRIRLHDVAVRRMPANGREQKEGASPQWLTQGVMRSGVRSSPLPKRRSRSSEVGIICTIGYQERSVLEFIRVLRGAGVEVLVDVRAVPLSRRAEFRKNALAAVLKDAGIKYIGLPA